MVHLIAEGEDTSRRISVEKIHDMKIYDVLMSVHDDDELEEKLCAVALCSELVKITHRGHEGMKKRVDGSLPQNW